MSSHVVCLTKGGGGEDCLAGEAFYLSGGCSRADVLGDAGGQ